MPSGRRFSAGGRGAAAAVPEDDDDAAALSLAGTSSAGAPKSASLMVEAALTEAQQTLLRWYEDAPAGGSVDEAAVEALSDDLNMPAVLARLHQITSPADRAATLAFLGFSLDASAVRGNVAVSDDLCRRVEALLVERAAARASKNWGESDRIRDALAALNIAVKDNKDGTTSWEVKS